MRFFLLSLFPLLLGLFDPTIGCAQQIDWSSGYSKPIAEKGKMVLFPEGALFFQNDGKKWKESGSFTYQTPTKALQFPGDLNDLVKKKELFDSGFYRPDLGLFVFSKKTNAANKKYQLFQSKWVDGKWEKPELLFFVEEDNNYQSPVWSTDLSKLYFSTDEETGFGGMDIFYVGLHKGVWNIPKNIGSPINTFSNELFAFPTSEEGIVFVSDRAISAEVELNLYYANSTSQYKTYRTPVLFPPNIQQLKPDGLFLFNEVSRSGYFQQMDLGYRFSICKNQLIGTFEDMDELPKDLELLLISENGITTTLSFSKEGFKTGLPPNETILIQAKAKGYEVFQKEIKTLDLTNPNQFTLSISLEEEKPNPAPVTPPKQAPKISDPLVETPSIPLKKEGPQIKDAPASQADESGIIMVGGGVFKHPSPDEKEMPKTTNNPVEKRPVEPPVESVAIEKKVTIEEEKAGVIKEAKAEDADDSGIIMVGGGVFKHPTEEEKEEAVEQKPTPKKELGIKDVKGNNIEMKVEEDGLIILKGADD